MRLHWYLGKITELLKGKTGSGFRGGGGCAKSKVLLGGFKRDNGEILRNFRKILSERGMSLVGRWSLNEIPSVGRRSLSLLNDV